MSQTIIQLSEKNSPDNINRDNGDYEIVLKGKENKIQFKDIE